MTRLIDLDPRWFTFPQAAAGQDIRIGLTFLCPHCRIQRLGVEFDPPIDPAGVFQKLGIVWPKVSHRWNRIGDMFENLTLTPSIDASNAVGMGFDGHWHGVITNGEIR